MNEGAYQSYFDAGDGDESTMNDFPAASACSGRIMKIGFTGTRDGMSEKQKQLLESLLTVYPWIEFHHGDCLGADAEAHDLAAKFERVIIIHPPTNSALRAFKNAENAILCEERPYKERNQLIVMQCNMLIAAPRTSEMTRSGTWQTVQHARAVNKPILILDR